MKTNYFVETSESTIAWNSMTINTTEACRNKFRLGLLVENSEVD